MQPGSTSKSPKEIAQETGISHSLVRSIVKKDLRLKTFRRREVQLLSNADKKERLDACRQLKARLTKDKVARTWFSDERVFTVQKPTNTQNDRVYATVSAKRDVPQNSCSRVGSTSLRVLWCPWQCPNLARRRWCLSSREQRSTAHTTMTMC